MSSTFTGLTTALNALMSQRAALTVTGQNIANANTAGYTRQRAELTAVTGSGRVGINASTSLEPNGGGVTVSSIRRLSDLFVDARQRDAHGQAAYATAASTGFDQVEDILSEPSDNGLGTQLSQFWNSWHGVANNPDSVPARQALLSKAAAVVGTIARGRQSVDAAYTDTRSQLDALATQVNVTAQGVATLNDKIRVAKNGGESPNELIDQRDQLVLQLSELTGARANAHDDGTVDVTVEGVGLVTGIHALALNVNGGATIDSSSASPLTLSWSSGGTAGFASGTIGGVVDTLRQTLPDAANGYDQVAATLATSVNAIHQNGQDLDGNPTGDFFAGTDAKTLSVAVTDPRLVGAGAQTGAPNLDSSIADAIAKLSSSSTGADVKWSSFVAATGVASAASKNQLAVHTSISQTADANRASASGVSLDEEMSNMLMYQRAYEGAARVMTAVDSMLDTLINRTGR